MKQRHTYTRLLAGLLLAMTLPAAGLTKPGQADPLIEALVPGSIKVHSTEEVLAYLHGLHFEWPVTSDGPTLIVPRIVTNDLPDNWETGLDVASRKSIFIRLVAPLILIANEQINADRTYILDALASGHGADLHSSERYRMIVASYELPADTAPLKVLKRVDIIPPALAISQAILESGWGTSRFAAQGNALYGEWTWGDGMEPMQRDTSLGDYGVQSFSSLLRSALSYMLNLNTSRHYRDFRSARMEMRLLNEPLDGCSLATHLSAYAALDGKIYRKTLCDLMQQNNLTVADSAVLASPPAEMLDFQLSETLAAITRTDGRW
ncbi:MAG: glucosaminidase domain-containing protein [Pseudohongiellaceae bacterium]